MGDESQRGTIPLPSSLLRQSSLDAANELFGNDLLNIVDVDEGAFRVASPEPDFSGDEYEVEGVGRELWPPSPYGAIPSSPYGAIPSSPYRSIPSSPYEGDRQQTSAFLDGHEFEQRLKFNNLEGLQRCETKGVETSAGAFIPYPPRQSSKTVGNAVVTAAAVGVTVDSLPVMTPTTAAAQISPVSSDSKIRKSKYRTQPLLPYVRAAIDQVRKGRVSVSKVAATTMYKGEQLMSERTLRRCVEQSQGDPTSIFYYPLLKMENPLKTGRKNKRHTPPVDKRAAAGAPADRYSAMTVKELKAELKARGLKQTGRKADHQQRLRQEDRRLAAGGS